MAMGGLTAWGISALINAGLILPVTRIPVLTNRGWWHAWALGTLLGATVGWQGWLAVVLYPVSYTHLTLPTTVIV